MLQYAAYAAFYMAAGAAPPSQCITMVDNYWHAFWFSMTSSATIGECWDSAACRESVLVVWRCGLCRKGRGRALPKH